jgi:hypothetical protein
VAIISMGIIIHRNRFNLEDENFLARFGTLVEGLKPKGGIIAR